jgi:hypothetical protein
MVQRFKDTLSVLKHSNPSVLTMYGLPKIQKLRNKMRPIMSNNGAYTERLVKKLKELSDPPGMFAKNTIEFLVKGAHFHVQMSPS